MLKVYLKLQASICLFLFIAIAGVCHAQQSLDKNKYIALDEIKPAMQAYCLTVYQGTRIDKFTLEVVDIARNISPGKNAILVKSSDERFIRTGPVAGCSGSPVYINGRLAGALAFAWPFSKEPIYGVTPIEEMLAVGTVASQQTTSPKSIAIDFSIPVDFDYTYKQMHSFNFANNTGTSGFSALSVPVIVSGIPQSTCEKLNDFVTPLGLTAVPGAGGSIDSNQMRDSDFSAGSAIAIPLVSGDISMAAIGTVTDVTDNKVYAFGHNFLGYGTIDLPMAKGYIYTVIPSIARSFKLGTAGPVIGAIKVDSASAIVGQMGENARTIPLSIKVSRYDNAQTRVYNCRIVNNQMLTPMILETTIAGAALAYGNLPPEHSIVYKGNIDVNGLEPLMFDNVSAGIGLTQVINDTVAPVSIMMNNPYKDALIKSVSLDIRIEAQNISSHIWSVDISDTKVKPGQSLNIFVNIESVRSGIKLYEYHFPIPQNLPPGKYTLSVMGAKEYVEFIRQTQPYKFISENITSLLSIINEILSIERDKLYFVLVLPPDGITIERAELPDLPASKASLFTDAKRLLKVQPWQRRIEGSIKTGTIVVDQKTVQITVEK